MLKHNKQLGYGNQLWRTKYSLRSHANVVLVGFTRRIYVSILLHQSNI